MSKNTQMIEKYIDETIQRYTSELRRQGLLKDNKRTPFQKTEVLLYNYNNFKAAIQDKYEQIEAIEQSIQVTKNFISVIDAALDILKDDHYFDIIRMKYFEGKTREEIAEHFDVDVSTISRNKNRLINLLQIRLFSDEVIYQIFS